MTEGTVLAPGGLAEPVVALENTVTCGGIGEYSVTYAARYRGSADREPISEDAEDTSVRAICTTGGTHDDKSTLV